MNIKNTGHLVEQPTRIRNFRPELGVFHGYSFQRRSQTVIEAWLPHECNHCGSSIYIQGHFIRVGSASDEDIMRHGLRKYEGIAEPIRGLRVTPSSPYLCDPCRKRWLEGEALEVVDENATVRNYAWQS